MMFQPAGRGARLPEVYCIISCLGCFGLFSKVGALDYVSLLLPNSFALQKMQQITGLELIVLFSDKIYQLLLFTT